MNMSVMVCRGLVRSVAVAGAVVLSAACSSDRAMLNVTSDAGIDSSDNRAVGSVVDATVVRPSVAELIRLNQWIKFDYDPYYSLEAMAADSDVVIVGRVIGAGDGGIRSFYLDPTPGDPYGERPFFSFLDLEVEVDEMLGGKTPDVLKGNYKIEVLTPRKAPPGGGWIEPISAAEYEAVLPDNIPAILFLQRSWFQSSSMRTEGVEPGVVYLVPGVQGFLLEEGGVVLTATGEPVPGGPKSSLAEVAAELRASAGGGGSVTAVSIMQR